MNDSKVLEGSMFADKKSRFFELYKGWFIVGGNGEVTRDELTTTKYGPLKIIPDPLSHGSWHTLSNLIGLDGKKILPIGVRSIEHYREGYYLLEDNNEDELIKRGDVKGGYRVCDYVEREQMWYLTTGGCCLESGTIE